jgi:hypothetical protein
MLNIVMMTWSSSIAVHITGNNASASLQSNVTPPFLSIGPGSIDGPVSHCLLVALTGLVARLVQRRDDALPVVVEDTPLNATCPLSASPEPAKVTVPGDTCSLYFSPVSNATTSQLDPLLREPLPATPSLGIPPSNATSLVCASSAPNGTSSTSASSTCNDTSASSATHIGTAATGLVASEKVRRWLDKAEAGARALVACGARS